MGGFSLSDITSAIGDVVSWFDDGVKRDVSADYALSTRVADAKRAGIHPLYALGAPTTSSSFIAGQRPSTDGVARALDSLTTREKKNPNADLERDLLRSQRDHYDALAIQALSDARRIASLTAAGNGVPSLPDKVTDPNAAVGGYPRKYWKVWNNKTGKYEVILNPELGFEMPESISAYHYGAGQFGNDPRPGITHEQGAPYKGADTPNSSWKRRFFNAAP